MNEQELVNRAKKGDDAAFEELLHLYEKPVYTLCLRFCGRSEDAEDAAQEAFLSAWRALPSFRGESAFSTWLYRLASNACVDLLRRRKHENGSVSFDDPESTVEVRDEAPTPEAAAEGKETAELLKKALLSLPEEYRTVVILREVQQLSYDEIAEAADLELGTVKSRISRGRLMMRNYLAANGNFFASRASKKTEAKERSVKKHV